MLLQQILNRGQIGLIGSIVTIDVDFDDNSLIQPRFELRMMMPCIIWMNSMCTITGTTTNTYSNCLYKSAPTVASRYSLTNFRRRPWT